jgi:hypothetical protein
MILKYIILENQNTPILFPRGPFSHYEISKNLGEVKSAGFCNICFGDGKLQINCFGESSTLAIKSNPEEDKAIIKKFITNKY